ncbi:MAG: hypothetical protein H0Z28_06410 [Archaeoglobus sp.]|nr:hypothetical protein [Archaeoglobus sp.]
MSRLTILLVLLGLILFINTSSAIIIQPDKTEYFLGEPIKLQVYTAGNATIQLIKNGIVVWEKRMDESGTVYISTSSMAEGNYTVYAADDRGEVVEFIRLEKVSATATLEIKSKIEGNLTLCGKTNLPDGYKLKVKVDGAEKEVEIFKSSYCANFDVEEGVYTAKVLFANETLNESRIYVEGFKIRSVRFQPELFVGEPLNIKVSANLKGFDVKIAIYSNKTEKKLSKHVYSDSGEIVFNAWLPPADYSVMILVIHGNSTDIMKLPLKIKESFLSASIENLSDGKAVILAKAPIGHVLWFVSGSKVKKSIVGEERKVLASIETEGKEVMILDQLNRSEDEVLEMLNTGEIEVPHVKLYLNQTLKVEKTPESGVGESGENAGEKIEEGIKETEEKETKENVTESQEMFEGVNVFAAVLTVLIVGGILAALVVMIRG